MSKSLKSSLDELANWEILSADFFNLFFLEKFFLEHYQNVNQFGSRSGPPWVQTVCEKISAGGTCW